MNLHPSTYADLVARALDEDLGEACDLTSAACIPSGSLDLTG